jgi:serine/threonine-protein kinase
MAEVWLGVYDDGKQLPRPVALKRILPHLCDQLPVVEMFLSEARLAALLQHPNIVRTHEVGILERQPFIAMELVDGVDLRRLMSAGATPLPIGLCLYVIMRLCDALAYVHTLRGPRGVPLGLIHRDISHSNVMLTRRGVVKLLDFGVAKAAQSSSLAQTHMGELKGKLGYMAPEILREAKYDHRADLFSVGVVLYELLVNDRLFKGTTHASMLAMNLGCVVPPPSHRRRDMSAALERIVLRALAAQPEARFASAQEMLSALRALPEAYSWGERETVRLVAERVGHEPEARLVPAVQTRALATRPRRAWPFAVATLATALAAGVGAWLLTARSDGHGALPPAPLQVAGPGPSSDVVSSAELTLPLPGARVVIAPTPTPPTPTTTTTTTTTTIPQAPPVTRPSRPTRIKRAAATHHPAHVHKPSADALINGHELMNPLGK